MGFLPVKLPPDLTGATAAPVATLRLSCCLAARADTSPLLPAPTTLASSLSIVKVVNVKLFDADLRANEADFTTAPEAPTPTITFSDLAAPVAFVLEAPAPMEA